MGRMYNPQQHGWDFSAFRMLGSLVRGGANIVGLRFVARSDIVDRLLVASA